MLKPKPKAVKPTPSKKRALSTDDEGEDFRGLLRSTGTPGVFVNKTGALVDERGVALTLTQLQQADADRFAAVLGEEVDTPVKFMRAVVQDPRTPLQLRLDAAKAVAPYTDRKMPTALEGPTPGSPISVNLLAGLDLSVLEKKERTLMMSLFRKLAETAPDSGTHS
jgi:hypothetical protein